MVQRLDERLTQDASDLDGWLRLMRAYQVLGETEKAKASRDRAKLSFANDQAALAKIDAAARDMGL
jgi:cytochrome c-type biogenesis protein CcmH